MATRHDAYLYTKDGWLHFGCDNPFCSHPLVPNHWTIPAETKDFRMEVLEHNAKAHTLKIKVTNLHDDTRLLKAGMAREMECEDTLPACKEAFTKLWPEVKFNGH